MAKILRPLLVLLLGFTALFGFAYPAVVTAVAQLTFPWKASGSMLVFDGRPLGSRLIGQPFTRPEVFWGRPSATAPYPYNAAASAASNLGPLNPALRDAVTARLTVLRAADPGNTRPVPIDLVTASGSGLDPHISAQAAYYQVPRVSAARSLPESVVRRLVEDHLEGRLHGLDFVSKVNVLQLNLALKNMEKGWDK